MRAPLRAFWNRHSLTIVAGGILAAWIVCYCFSDQNSHWGAFFGNAIADWSGLVMMIVGTKYLMERGSKESTDKPCEYRGVRRFVHDHSLGIFLIVTGIGWVLLFNKQDPNAKWGQVTGNIVSEWTQVLGLLYLTKRLYERGSAESK